MAVFWYKLCDIKNMAEELTSWTIISIIPPAVENISYEIRLALILMLVLIYGLSLRFDISSTHQLRTSVVAH